MNNHQHDRHLSGERSAPLHLRKDVRTHDVVNQAIAAIPAVGVQGAAEFLRAMNVPSDVALRTLANAGQRRTTRRSGADEQAG